MTWYNFFPFTEESTIGLCPHIKPSDPQNSLATFFLQHGALGRPLELLAVPAALLISPGSGQGVGEGGMTCIMLLLLHSLLISALPEGRRVDDVDCVKCPYTISATIGTF